MAARCGMWTVGHWDGPVMACQSWRHIWAIVWKKKSKDVDYLDYSSFLGLFGLLYDYMDYVFDYMDYIF